MLSLTGVHPNQPRAQWLFLTGAVVFLQETPFRDIWFRGALRDWMEALIDERRLEEEGFFDPKPIRAAWADHLSGRRNRQHELWDVAMFQAWHEASGA